MRDVDFYLIFYEKGLLGTAHFVKLFDIFTHAIKTFFCQCSIHAQIIFSKSQNEMQPNLIIAIQKFYSHYLPLK